MTAKKLVVKNAADAHTWRAYPQVAWLHVYPVFLHEVAFIQQVKQQACVCVSSRLRENMLTLYIICTHILDTRSILQAILRTSYTCLFTHDML